MPKPTNNVAHHHHESYDSYHPINNDIATNEVADVDAQNNKINRDNNKLSYYVPYYVPKYFKITGKYANEVYKAKLFSKYQKYNIIAYKDKYQNVPYIVVSALDFLLLLLFYTYYYLILLLPLFINQKLNVFLLLLCSFVDTLFASTDKSILMIMNINALCP